MTKQIPQNRSELEEMIADDGIDFEDIDLNIRSHFDLDLEENEDYLDLDEVEYEE